MSRNSTDPSRRRSLAARQALQRVRVNIGRGSVRQALREPLAKLGAGETDEHPTPTQPIAEPLTVVSVLGPDPYSPGQVLRALREGKSLREIDKALSALMSRRRARILINQAKTSGEQPAVLAQPETDQ